MKRLSITPSVEIVPETDKCMLSIRLHLFILTDGWNCARKFAPIMGVLTSAVVNSHGKIRLILKSNFNKIVPNVLILPPLADCRLFDEWKSLTFV